LVEILTTQVGITGSSVNLKDTLLDRKQRDIESTTTEICKMLDCASFSKDKSSPTVDDNLPLLRSLVKTVGKSGRSGLVDNTHNVETRDSSGILGSGTLSVVEVGGDSDDGVGDLLSEISLRDLFHLAENHGGDLFGGESLLSASNLNTNTGLTVLGDDLEGEVLDVVLRVVLECAPMN